MPSDELVRSEPSVDSEVREERILARRLRIENRREKTLRLSIRDQADEIVVEKLKDETQKPKQMTTGFKNPTKLKNESLDVVSNIKTAADSKEIKRRIKVIEENNSRKEKVKNEKEISFDKHEEMLLLQKEACDAMLEEKTKLINEFKEELKDKDKQYVEELKNQAADVDMLMSRMTEQINILSKAYKTELKHIEAAFIRERMQLLSDMDEEWENLLKERKQKEEDFSKNRDNQAEVFESMLNAQRVQDSEEYNQIKIKLEKDIQMMQQELQEMQATYQLNQDKLEYNFQVLRKRDEENIITKSIQKKKITRLHDIYMFHSKKNKKQEEQFVYENQQLTLDYDLLVEKYKNFLNKAKLTIDSNKGKFGKLWLMNEEECKKYASRILKIDEILHEQQLGIKWTLPDMFVFISFMKNVGPISVSKSNSDPDATRDDLSLRKANLVSKACGFDIENINLESSRIVLSDRQEDGEMIKNLPKEQFCEDYFYEPLKVVDGCLDKVPKHLIKHIFKLICNETGFLIEEKVWSLLSSLEVNEQTLMKLDSVLNVMQIENEEDVRVLSLYFLKNGTKNKIIAKEKAQDEKEVNLSESFESRNKLHEAFITPYPSQHNLAATNNENNLTGDPDDPLHTILPEYSDILIHPNDVLLALKAFVGEHNKATSKRDTTFKSNFHKNLQFDDVFDAESPSSSQNKIENAISPLPKPKINDLLLKHDLKRYFDETEIAVENRDDSMDKDYWLKYGSLDTGFKKTWDALAVHFENYYQLLEDRAKLIEQHRELVKQNIEIFIELLTRCAFVCLRLPLNE
ncbi:hypothetical protein HELRODRAFT_188640 [Helobdella robusta]|uniref:Dynein regulatory complex protein 1 C-terminal domain-containing protein n=1 Tax=Helobdella robusta TaxID=6412 RepID=T1FQ75_HELRO|nr:hypothetical protein HELRODRAFT_188640 [Helobdella robusta]ESO02263.1 hypothetical protein HELRODRAFT_188640 [Helobdella robusta]